VIKDFSTLFFLDIPNHVVNIDLYLLFCQTSCPCLPPFFGTVRYLENLNGHKLIKAIRSHTTRLLESSASHNTFKEPPSEQQSDRARSSSCKTPVFSPCSEKSSMCCRAYFLQVTNKPISCERCLFPMLSLPSHSILTVEARHGRGAKEVSDNMTVQGHD